MSRFASGKRGCDWHSRRMLWSIGNMATPVRAVLPRRSLSPHRVSQRARNYCELISTYRISPASTCFRAAPGTQVAAHRMKPSRNRSAPRAACDSDSDRRRQTSRHSGWRYPLIQIWRAVETSALVCTVCAWKKFIPKNRGLLVWIILYNYMVLMMVSRLGLEPKTP